MTVGKDHAVLGVSNFRYAELDGMRGIAILMAVWHYYVGPRALAEPSAFTGPMYDNT